MLSNAYFLAKFRFDTAENEPAKNLQNFRKMHFRKMHLFDRILEETQRLDAISAGTSGANYDAAFQSAFDALFGQPADCPRSLFAFVGMELITSSRIS